MNTDCCHSEMPSALEVFQCEGCLRNFKAGQGTSAAEIVPRLPGMVPSLGRCGLPECAALAAAIAEQERRIDEAGQRRARQQRLAIQRQREECRLKKQKRPARPVGQRGFKGSSVKGHSAPAQCHKGMPPEKDGDDGRAPVAAAEAEGPAVGSSQGEFHAAVDVGPALRKLLDYFLAHYGEYISLPVLEEVCGHHAVNSRCSELRELIPADHDIDQRSLLYAASGKLHSHYRLCRKSESWRLLNREKRAEGQREFLGEQESTL